jgi:hypothetical protein
MTRVIELCGGLRHVLLFCLILCFAVSDYVRNVEDCPGLEDRLSQHNTTYELQGGGREPLFPSHLTPSQIHQGIKSRKLLQGSFLASRENFLEGQVNVEGQDKMVSSYRQLWESSILKFVLCLTSIGMLRMACRL